MSGSIPSSIVKIRDLGSLDLSSNQLTGNIPSTIGSIGNPIYLFIYLNFSNNKLSGDIPSSFGNIANLYSLDLSKNQFTGQIPSSFGNLVNLKFLNLDSSHLEGEIPSSFGNLGSRRNWVFLNLSHNNLSGNIPEAVANLPARAKLNLSNNHFTFDGMELFARFPNAVYNHQKNIPLHQIGNTLSVYAGGKLSNNTYIWYRCEGTVSTPVKTIVGDSEFHPSESGSYHVKVLNSIATKLVLYSKALDYIAPNNNIATSTENEVQKDNAAALFLIYPNPVKNGLYVRMKEGTVSLINQSGEILVTKAIHDNDVINVSNLPSGLYYLKNMQTGEVKKVVISR